MKKNKKSPKILLLDIETSPMMSFHWGLFDQNIALNQVKEHTYILSWSAKWLGQKEIMYMDNRNAKHFSDDKKVVEGLVKLLDQCDYAVGHNIKRFDNKKINYRCIVHGIKKPSSYDLIDTLTIAKRSFAFDSNKLEHLAKILKVKNKKMTKREFAGFDLWLECMAGNRRAWNEMKEYNIQDTITLEDIYHKLQPWAKEVNFMHITETIECGCGSDHLTKHSKKTNKTGVYQRWQCQSCGSLYTDKINLREKGFNKKLLIKE